MAKLFKCSVLGDIPAHARVFEQKGKRFARWTDDEGHEHCRKVVRSRTREGKLVERIVLRQSARWYGKIQVGRGWQRVKLYRDKQASEHRLKELQGQQDQRASGMITPDQERLELPLSELLKRYHDELRTLKRKDAHVRISEWMLNQLVQATGWKFFRDITPDSVLKVLPGLAQTASYQNKFIVRAKAFVHWALPEGWVDPLKKLRRVNEKNGKRNRERRAGTDAEIRALFAVRMPDDRTLAYALAAFNGLRRNEAAGLTGGDLHLDDEIPYVGLKRKQGETSKLDYIPLHPYVIKLLAGRLLMPGAKVLASVPDMKTVVRDLERAKVNLTDGQGRRLDYHALRHTFQTNLDRTGCSRATKKRLMRHANEDVTDGYAHAERAEMLAALRRIPAPDSPQVQQQQQIATGTDGRRVVQIVDQAPDSSRQQLARSAGGSTKPLTVDFTRDNPASGTSRHALSAGGLPHAENRDNVVKSRPSTQVD